VAAFEAFTEALHGDTQLGTLDAGNFMAALIDEVLASYLTEVEDIERRIDALDEEALHELRIRAKKMRYSAEFFRSLFRDKAAKAYLSELTDVQDCLGTLNDGAVARQIVSDLEAQRDGVEPSVFARGAGIVLGWNACRIAADLKQLPAAWERFTDARIFWK
jgi:CHAD domain-containing protein